MYKIVRKFVFAFAAALVPFGGGAAAIASDASMEARIDSLLSKMTLQEKVGQLNQLNTASFDTLSTAVAEGRVGSILNEVNPEVVNALQRKAVEESRLGIPLVFARDVIHGFNTIFPIPLGQAATWNPELVELGARIAAVEASACGVRWTFSPMMDVSRDARWGRIAESAGEDPLLNERMGLAMIRGYQTDDLTDPTAMAACAKHFAGYGFSESGKDYNTTWLPLPLLNDVVLPPFEAAAKAGAATFMTSFNDINGVPSSGNRWLMRDVLRDRWGFDGVLVSDWNAITEMISHGVAPDKRAAAALAAAAGVDVDMEGHAYSQALEALVKAGRIDEKVVDGLVRDVLRLKMRLGLFENPYVDTSKPSPAYLPSHLDAARRTAEEGAVLLKNNGLLPFGKSVKKLAVVGPMADAAYDQCGTWAPDIDKSRSVTPLTALRDAFGTKNILYAPGLKYTRDRSLDGIAAAVEAARGADAVVCFVGEEAVMSGEAHCMADLDLKGAQSALIEALKETGKPLAVVFMAGRPLTVEKEIALADAVLYSFHGGTMAGPALANLLTGKANPSGKLPATMARMTGQYPIYYAHKQTGRPPEWTIDLDAIPVEAPQTSTGCTSYFLDAGKDPLYPFGYGLSYTTFEISEPRLSANALSMASEKPLTVTCTVKNTGNREGAEVVQFYVRDMFASLARPVKELKDFKKVTLKPGESKEVSFSIYPSQLSFSGLDGERLLEPGEFRVWTASNSASGKPASFSLVEEKIVGSVPDEWLRCWEPGEKPEVGVNLRNDTGVDGSASVSSKLMKDDWSFVDEWTKEIKLDAGSTAGVKFDALTLAPGFYRVEVRVGDHLVRRFNIGYDPTSIVSAADRQPDFEAFWHNALKELAATAPEYKLTLDKEKSGSARDVYLVEMKSVPDSVGAEPVTIRGYYSAPKDGGKHPALLCFEGYDGGQGPYWGPGDINPDWAEFHLSSRGQMLNNRGENKNTYGDWFAWNFGDKDHYYYRGAFMDVVRAVDFITSRETTDTTRVYACGQSQGGAFTVASAALGGGRVKGIAPAVTFLGDYPDYFRVEYWPGNVAKRRQRELGLADEDMYAFLSYFDTKNLAPWVTCPVFGSYSLQDATCPPHTNFASHNLFNTDNKRYVINPVNGHWVNPSWYGDYYDFFYSLFPR
ncbi:MAG: beta-glucosidase BglX [[Clostridium] fimetarium]|nr:beta-glucosidase BglX [Alistipes timonensis]MCM1405209.1 beta-glucosidase BglX [[Clostridium] fimetarium]